MKKVITADSKEEKAMKKQKIISILTIVVVIQLSLPGCSLKKKSDNHNDSYNNSSEVTSVINSDSTNSILFDSSFSNTTIVDSDSAMSVIKDMADVIGIANVSDELEIEFESSIEGYDFYRFKQVYNGIEVYGKEVIVVADDNNNAFSLNSTYESILNADIKSELSNDEVEKMVSNSDEFVNVEDFYIEFIDQCIYFLDNTPLLCYKYCVTAVQNSKICSYTILADSNNGDIVFQDDNIVYDSKYYELDDGAKIVNDISFSGEDNKPRIVDISEYNNQYQMFDLERRIGVWRAANKLSSNWFRIFDLEFDMQNIDHYIWDKESDCPSKVGITSLKNIQDTFDYYKESLKWISTDGQGHFPILLFTDDLSMHNNAAFWNYENPSETILRIGTNDNPITFGNYLDVMAHEYTHAVSNYIVNGWKSKQGKAMNEAYSDIMGEVIEYSVTGTNDWKMNSSRNIGNPSATMDEKGKHITKYSEYKDSTDCHLSSTLISHIAYQMNVGYDDATHSNTAIDMDTLGKLWFYSLQFLPSDCSFADCRRAVSLSADILNAKGVYVPYYTINKAFDEAGIANLNPYYSVKSNFTLSVYEADKKTKVSNYHLDVSKYENGNFDKTVFEGDVSEESFSLSLENGDYLLTIQGEAEHQYVTALNVRVGEWFCENDHIDFYSYWYNDMQNDNSLEDDLKSERNDAEKYAQIVMSNELYWLDTMNEIDSFTGTNSCWFEDLDFDGTPEFIVGGSNWVDTDGWIPATNRYYIYNFTEDGGMKRIIDEGVSDMPKPIQFDFVTMLAKKSVNGGSADKGFEDIGMELLYDKDKDSYTRVYLTAATGGNYYGLYNVEFSSVKKEEKLTGFDVLLGTIDDNEYNEITQIASDFSKNKKHCDLEIYSIPCTSTSSSGYDSMNDSDKLSELVKSYNTFKITQTDFESNVVSEFLNVLSGLKGYDKSAIKTEYKRIVDQKLEESRQKDPNMYDIEYTLYDIDGNNIPELCINTGTSYADHSISIYSFDSDTNKSYLVEDGISGFHVSFYCDITNNQLVAAGGVTGAGFITRFTMYKGELSVEEQSFDRDKYELSDIGNFMSEGLSYYPTLKYSDQFYRDGYTVNSLYDIIDYYNY